MLHTPPNQYPIPPSPHAPVAADPAKTARVLSIIGFVLSIVVGLPGSVVSIIALVKLRNYPKESRVLAIFGIIIGFLYTFFSIIFIIIVLLAAYFTTENNENIAIPIANPILSLMKQDGATEICHLEGSGSYFDRSPAYYTAYLQTADPLSAQDSLLKNAAIYGFELRQMDYDSNPIDNSSPGVITIQAPGLSSEVVYYEDAYDGSSLYAAIHSSGSLEIPCADDDFGENRTITNGQSIILFEMTVPVTD